MTKRPPTRLTDRLRPPPQRGFTLVEILVALAVVAIALTAGMQATGSLTQLSQRQQDHLLAELCAENQLAKVRLAKTLPGAGNSSESCLQAGRTFEAMVQVMPTPNPNFRRIDVKVLSPAEELAAYGGRITLLQLSTVVGRY